MSLETNRKASSSKLRMQDTYSCYVSCARLRHVQSLLKSPHVNGAPDALLCILGIDARYNDAMKELANYLLFDIFDRYNQTNKFGIDDEIYEDVVLVIRADAVDVYCNPTNYAVLLPLMAHWRHLHIHCLFDNKQNKTEDELEEFKISSFISMVDGCSTIGVPYSHTGAAGSNFEPMLIEKWPLIQAYALEGFAGQSFFTLKYQVVDVSHQLYEIYSSLDPAAVESLITDQLALFERNWNDMIAVCELQRRNFAPSFTEQLVSEPLQSYFEHGWFGEHDMNKSRWFPFVLFGNNTSRVNISKVSHGNAVQSAALLAESGPDGRPARHMICCEVAPKYPVKCTRTYFFAHDQQFLPDIDASTEHSGQDAVSETRVLVELYKACMEAVSKVVEVYSNTLNSELAVCEGKQSIVDYCKVSKLCLPSDWVDSKLLDNVEVLLEADTLMSVQECINLKNGEYIPCVKYASVSVYDIPSIFKPGRHLGSVSYADSFIDSSFPVSNSGSANETSLDSTYCLLTGNIPQHITWPLDDESRQLRSQLDLRLQQKSAPLMPGEMATLCLCDSYTSSLRQGELYIYDTEIVFIHKNATPIIIPTSQLESIHFYDGSSMNVVALLLLNYKHEFSSYLPASVCQPKCSHLTFALQPKTKAYRAVFAHVMPAWKQAALTPSWTTLDTLPGGLVQLHELLQKEFLMTTSTLTPLLKAKCSLPQLDRLLAHISISTAGEQTIPRAHLASVLGGDLDLGQFDDNKCMLVCVVIGGSEADCGRLVKLASSEGKILHMMKYPANQGDEWCGRGLQTALEQKCDSLKSAVTNVLLIVPWYVDIIDVVQSIITIPNKKYANCIKIGSVTVCIDVASFYMTNRYTLPALLDNCAQGWVNNVILTQSAHSKSDHIASVKHLIEATNSDVAFITEDHLFKGRTVDLMTSENSFWSGDAVHARYLLCPGWYWGRFDTGRPFPVVDKVVLSFSQALDRSRLSSRLKGLKSGLNRFPFAGNVYYVSGHLAISNELGIQDLTFVTLSGHLSITKRANSAKRSCLVFVGCQPNEKRLRDMLRECLPWQPEKKVHRTRDSLTQIEINKIHKEHRLDPLPEGWYYNGLNFVSMDGERSNIHPNLEKFLEAYLKKVNSDVDRHNETVKHTLTVELFD